MATTEGVVRAPFLVGDHRRLATLHHGNHGIGGAQIDANNLAHLFLRRCPGYAQPGSGRSNREILHIECIYVKLFDIENNHPLFSDLR